MQTEQSGLTTLTLPVHHQPVVIPNQNIMKICIVLNGTLSNSEAFQHQIKQFDNVIAADGGANKCFEFGIIPDYIIGDFDSVSSEVLDFFSNKSTQIVDAPSQSTVDFQEAIWLAESIFSGEDIQHGLDARRKIFLDGFLTGKTQKQLESSEHFQLTIFAGLSDTQIDHTMGNLLLGVSLPSYITLKFFKPDSEIYITKNSLTLDGENNDIVSVIPLQKTIGLNYKNLLYPVNNLDVDVGWLGSRNRMSGQQATIDFLSGTLLIVRYKSVD